MAIILSVPHGLRAESSQRRANDLDKGVVLETLRAHLELPWWVFCDRILETRLDRRGIDFVLAHPRLGIVVLTIDEPRDAANDARRILEAFLEETGFFGMVGGPIAVRQIDIAGIESQEALGSSLRAVFETGQRTMATDPDWVEALADLLAQPDDLCPAALTIPDEATWGAVDSSALARALGSWLRGVSQFRPVPEAISASAPELTALQPTAPAAPESGLDIKARRVWREIATRDASSDRLRMPLAPEERSVLSVDHRVHARRAPRPSLLIGLLAAATCAVAILLLVSQQHLDDTIKHPPATAFFLTVRLVGEPRDGGSIGRAAPAASAAIKTTSLSPAEMPSQAVTTLPVAAATDPSLDRDFPNAVKDSDDPALLAALPPPPAGPVASPGPDAQTLPPEAAQASREAARVDPSAESVLSQVGESQDGAPAEAALPPPAGPVASPGLDAQTLPPEAAQPASEVTQVDPPPEQGFLKLKEPQDEAHAQVALQPPSASPGLDAQATPEAAQVNPPAPPAIDAIKEVFNVVNGVFIREQPTANAKQLGGLDKGQSVLVTGRVVGANWLRVNMDHGGIGYVYGTYLRRQDTSKPKRSSGDSGMPVQLPADFPPSPPPALSKAP